MASNMRILAVDDNPDNLITLKALIREAFEEVAVFTALTGGKGLDIAAAEDPDVILLDIVMPGMDGFEFCRRIKSDENLKDIPVVFVTAIKGDKQSRILALECGAEAFLSKPIDESELTAQIRAMVKIKAANNEKRTEKQRLARLVNEKTQKLKKEHAKKLRLFEALKQENEARKQSEKALLEAKEFFELVFNTSPDAALVVRLEDGMILNVNEGFVSMFGYTKEEAINKRCSDIGLYKSVTGREKFLKKVNDKGYCDGVEVKLFRKDKSMLIGLMSSRVVMLKGVPYTSSNIRDITERKEMEDNLAYLSYHDHLTGLYNRRFFEREVKRLDKVKRLPLSIIVGDINGVKLINDAFGHTKGDKLIIDTARAISSCCRKGDILARTGGDEYALLLPNTDGATAYEMITKIQDACRKQNDKTANEAFHINVSLGYSTKVSENQDFDTVVKKAEKYMYQRKLLEHKSMHSAVIASIRATLLEKNEETEEHCERLIDMSKKVGVILGLSQKQMDELELLAALHDIGKIGIDDRILNKPGKLNDDEWYEMKKHPEIGHRIAMSSPELSPIAEYILCHHERWDGKGYPQNLVGEEIPLLSRIIAIVDAYDAMTQDRPYRKRMAKETAIKEIKRNAGTQFDPNIAKVFVCKVLGWEWDYLRCSFG